jgi:SAM-dependent methyltransferase
VLSEHGSLDGSGGELTRVARAAHGPKKALAALETQDDDAGMADDPALDLLHQHYELGLEEPRLEEALGSIEFARTLEVAARVLPRPPAAVADIGGGPGRYALELAGRGYTVVHRDLVPLHVEQLRRASGTLADRVDTAVGDARDLDLDDASADAVLLLGPLYHLVEHDQRVRALREALRVARPGAPVLVSAISRWAPRLHGYLADRLYERATFFPDLVRVVEESGRLNDSVPGWFTGYCHRPDQLREEAEEAGLAVEDLVGLEGLAFAFGDLADRLADPAGREVVLDCARSIERVPELLGLSPHLLLVARASVVHRPVDLGLRRFHTIDGSGVWLSPGNGAAGTPAA